jgi:hypothetical protein
MTERDLWFTGGIERNPRVAASLGLFLSEFANLELMLIRMFALALNDLPDCQLTWAIFGRIQNVTDRCDILDDCAPFAHADEHVRGSISKFVQDIRDMNAIRNEYVHALYETNRETHEVRLTTWALSTGRKQKRKDVSAEALQDATRQTRALYSSIMSALFPNEVRLDVGPEPSL